MTNLKNVNTNTNTATAKIIITKNEFSDIKIDNRIIPLFSSPVYLKAKSLKEKSKYNFNTLNSIDSKKLNSKVLSYKEIVSIFLKGFKLYNINMKDYLLNHKKLDLIEYLFFLRNNDKYYTLNIKLNKFLFLINKYMPILKYKSFLFNRLLFLPKRLFKPQSDINFIYGLRHIEKILLFKFNNNKKLLLKFLNSDSALTDKTNPVKLKASPLEDSNLKNSESLKAAEVSITKINGNKNTQRELAKKLATKILRRKLKIKKRIMKKILAKGKNLIKDLDLLINEKQNLIKNYNLELPYANNVKLIDSVEIKTSTIPNNLKPLQKSEPLSSYNFRDASQASDAPKKIMELKLITDNSNNKHNFEKSVKTILKNNKFLSNKDSIVDPIFGSQSPVSLFYYSNTNNKGVNISKPILHQYLKEMSIYNISKKGIFIFYSILTGFNFNKENNKLYKNIYKLLAASFKSMYCLISKPVFISTPDKIVIQLFYFLFIPNILKLKKFYKYTTTGKGEAYSGFNYKNMERKSTSYALSLKRKNKIKRQYSKFRKIKINVRIKLRNLSNVALTKVFSNKLKFLCLILNKIFKKPVELDLIRTHYPYNDSNILVNLLGIMINKIKLRIIIRRFFEKAIIKNVNTLYTNKLKFIPAFLSGVTIRVAGRLLTHKVVPRRTVKMTRRGASATGRINFKDVATYTNKNKRGAFSITVKSGQNFF